MKFCREHAPIFGGAEPVASVALVRVFESTAFAPPASGRALQAVEQLLIEHHLPYEIAYADRLSGIDRYRAVILADQMCLTDRQCEALIDYVRQGGSLIATDGSGDCDEHFVPRMENGLAAVSGHPSVYRIGELELDQRGPSAGAAGHGLVRAPVNPGPLLDAIDAAWPVAERPVHVAPAAGTGSALARLPDGSLVLHVLHYDWSRPAPPVTLTWSAGRPERADVIHSPWPAEVEADDRTCTLVDWQVHVAVQWSAAGGRPATPTT